MDKKIFEVEISSGGPESYKTSAVLTMPCTQAELCDALQKARVQDVKTCRNELTRIRYPGITADMIGRNVDLLELNLLALRLTMLGEDDRMGLDGLLQIEKENHTAPFPLSQHGQGDSEGVYDRRHGGDGPIPSAGTESF